MTPNKIFLIWGALLSLAIGSCLFNSHVETEFSQFLPRSSTDQEQFLVDQLRQGPGSQIIIISLKGNDIKTLAKTSSQLGKFLRISPLFSQALNGEKLMDEESIDFIFRNRYLLSPTLNANRFKADELYKILSEKLISLSISSGSLEKQFFQRDPTGELLSILSSWNNKSSILKKHGVWFSKQLKKALLVAEISSNGFDLDDFELAINYVRQKVAEIHTEPDIIVDIVGPPAYAVASRASIKRDITTLSVIATLLVIGILFTAYRSIRLILLSLIPMGSAIAASIALVSLIFNGIHGITLAFGIVVLGVAIDYPIHLFNHLQTGKTAKCSMERIWPTMRLGVITTILGYFSMFFSGFDGLIQLASFSVIGLSTAALVTRFVLPLFISKKLSFPKTSPLIPIANLIQNQGRGSSIVIVMLFLSLLFLSFNHKVLWENDVAQLSPVPKKQIELDKAAREELNMSDAGFVVAIKGGNEQGVLEMTETLSNKFDLLKQNGEIEGFDSASKYLPSMKTQKRRLNDIPKSADIQKNLLLATENLPFRPDTFQPFVDEISSANKSQLLTSPNIVGTILHTRIKNLFFKQNDAWYSMITFSGLFNREKLNREIAKYNQQGVFGLELRKASNDMVIRYRNRALLLFGLGLIVIIGTLRIGLRSWLATSRVVIPLTSAILTAAAILVIFGIKFSLFHLAASLLVLGLGLDYALFFNREEINPSDRLKTCHALLVCNLSTLSVFGALSFSTTPVLTAIGLTVALGSFLSLIFSSIFAQNVFMKLSNNNSN
ncbi:MAG: MMPL family transporter [Nitrospinales bacterium]